MSSFSTKSSTSPAATVPFQYQPLDRARREIRLLKLLPRTQWPNDFLPTCSIFHTSIDQCPPYLALSYVWGSTCDQKEIIVNGRTFKVTKNLFEALIGIVGSETMIIWIDAICINQTDDEEKGWQVELMGDIYRKTSEVLAWLGPSASNSDKVMDHLNVLGSIAQACGLFGDMKPFILLWAEMLRIWPNQWNPSTSSLKSWPIHARELEILLHAISGVKKHQYLINLDDLKHLFRRPWWARIWVLQEISLPERAQFVCGTKRISRYRFRAAFNAYHALWNALLSNPRLLRPYIYPVNLSDVISSNVQLMLSMWKLYQQEEFGLMELLRAISFRPPAQEILRRRQNFLSTDPRDKIFALLNLINDKKKLSAMGVFPDYTKSKEEIYTRVMVAILKQGHVSLLSQAYGVERPSGLPSWVPDWSEPALATLQTLQGNFLDFDPPFRACGSKQRCDIRLGNEKKTVLVMGIICDEVLRQAYVSRLPELSGLSSCALPLRWLYEVQELSYLTEKSYSNPQVRLETAARAAHAGMRIGTSGSLERGYVFPEAMKFLEKLNRVVTSDDDLLEWQQSLEQDFWEIGADHRITGSQRMQTDLIRISYRRSPFLTSKGGLGIGSMEVKKGDVVALISSSQTPFILRPTGRRFMIVSEAYVDGIMDGEAAEDGQWDYIELE